ncbi:NADH:ubiquinone oxidoreductase, NADH-binding subunit (chain F) [Actinopolymorpha cephalotaxi]|uniref:NADH:ubiquinone oxidoreductase subunit F (NADH-binding) n=1 Tax=Actinopolymorpha cephalotaxi TaxID=504797 RepID=A0A1I2T5T0_9ACTN|nr:NADH-ubiquinone oxidoreductase-F iron-sulfur binding region domain-containing protein [Actinopolymorpha cephalotaxi]NYH82949.1 NADH:ubiquinone oxidoreductase subunit F (NADH-binding) [Actinopolymorpha cephalotaxi]SFG60385.1 NADH:ubiquinone oxidoreductase, NADH-binding subunit (chain F) [Actinopolymorpha cephalotaxi]
MTTTTTPVPQATAGSATTSEPPNPLPRLTAGWADAAGAPSLADHLDRYGGVLRPEPEHVLEVVRRSGLRGRGGAGFPTGRKLSAVATEGRRPGRWRRPVVVVNGCEGEPASGKDRTLLAYAPHLVLDGAAYAATAVGADEVYVCVHRHTPIEAGLRAAVAQRRDDRVRWHVVGIPARYVASEESALVHFLDTGDARPTTTPPRPFERGVGGRPTLVDNAETLAHLAQVVRHGAEWFRSVGTPTDPGTTLVTVGGAVRRPGVYEIVLGTPLESVLATAGAAVGEAEETGAGDAVVAALVGGYFGGWVPLPRDADLPLGHDPAGPDGTRLGAGVVVALPARSCGLAETARVVRYLAGESAGQCGPCVFGLPAVAADLEALAAGRADRDLLDRLHRRLDVIPGRGACRHPDGAVGFARSALRTFAADVRRHAAGHPCRGVERPPVLPLPSAARHLAGEPR